MDFPRPRNAEKSDAIFFIIRWRGVSDSLFIRSNDDCGVSVVNVKGETTTRRNCKDDTVDGQLDK